MGAAETCALGVGTYYNDTSPARWLARGVTASTGEGGRFRFRSPVARGWLHLPADDGDGDGGDGDDGTGGSSGGSSGGGGSGDVASRCVDHSTRLPIPAPLVAPPGWQAVSPLSTAAAALVVHRGLAGVYATYDRTRVFARRERERRLN